jgi:hypothetical protein
MAHMPRDGAIIFSDLTGKLDVLRVSCAICSRTGSYRLTGLIERRGRDGKVVDWLDEISVVRAFVQLADDFQKALGLSDTEIGNFAAEAIPEETQE